MAVQLIAHRGGIVDERSRENTVAALRRAMERGYWGVEIDLRETLDHEVLLSHDSRLERVYGLELAVRDARLEDIRARVAASGQEPPPTLAEVAAECAQRMHLMIEIKESAPSEPFLERIRDVLSRHGLLADALVIGSTAGKDFLRGTARTAVNLEQFRRRSEDRRARSALSREHFLFEHGNRLTPASVAAAAETGLPVVPTVNTFHYPSEPPHSGACRDIAMLLEAGVTMFQIDSDFEDCFPAG